MIISRHDLYSLPPLHKAAAAGNVTELTRLLADTAIESRAQTHWGADPQFPAHRDLTPLMVAAGSELGSVQAVRTLLERGASPRAVSAAGVDALWYAAGSGDAERVAVLLAAGAEPRAVASDGRSTVAVAARAGGAEALRLLLQAGASPHPPTAGVDDAGLPHEAIPLFAAAAAGSAACVQLLLDAGARATLRDREENTALMFATGPEVVPLLLAAGCPRDARNSHGSSALDAILFNHRNSHGPSALGAILFNQQLLWTAAMRDDPECGDRRLLELAVQRRQAAVTAALLDAGVDPEGCGQDGQTALIGNCRTWWRNGALVRLLLARGAQAHAHDREGRTALHAAAQSWGQPPELTDVIRVLVEAGLPVDVRDNRGRTPLHCAVANDSGARRAIPVLLDLGANIEARDADGQTPLMVAAGIENNSYPIVRLLLERGASPRARTPDGRTARDVAAGRVAELEKQLAAPEPVPADPAQAIAAAAWQRLALRSARVTLQALSGPGAGTPASEAPPQLPEPIWLGYRLQPRRAALSPCLLETDHVEEVCSCAHARLTEEMNDARCFPTVESVPEWFRATEDTQPVEVYAYRAFPLVFDASGETCPLTVEDLLGPDAPPPEIPDLTRFARLGYDVTEDQNGCSPLSPFCSGMYVEMSTLVNRCCLVDDLAAAYDLAVFFGVRQPEPGPYVIVEVWRAIAS